MYSSWWKRPRHEEKRRGERSKSRKVITQIREFDWTEASTKKEKEKKNADWGTITGQDLTEKSWAPRYKVLSPRGRCSHKVSYFNLHYRRCCRRSFGVGAALGRRFLPPLHSACTPQPYNPSAPLTICCKTSQRAAAKILPLTPKISLRD